jgi:hypothetical protein
MSTTLGGEKKAMVEAWRPRAQADKITTIWYQEQKGADKHRRKQRGILHIAPRRSDPLRDPSSAAAPKPDAPRTPHTHTQHQPPPSSIL